MRFLPRRAWMELRDRVNPVAVNAVSLCTLLLIGWLDYITGYEFGFFIFYFIPVSISSWLCGKRSGVTMAFASAVCWFLSDKLTRHPYPNAYFIYWEMLMRYLSFLTTALTISRIRTMLLNEERLNEELQEALQEIKDLKKCIPVSESGEGMEEVNGVADTAEASSCRKSDSG
jgi:hypothetical protein